MYNTKWTKCLFIGYLVKDYGIPFCPNYTRYQSLSPYRLRYTGLAYNCTFLKMMLDCSPLLEFFCQAKIGGRVDFLMID
ncbi:MAG: hypothetical protein LBJ00_07550 [Planctomycetaceae bacterium]|nr:hypothetical protein [Planctomycetaceae bacterium]